MKSWGATRRLLCAVDGSEPAERAAEAAIDMAAVLGVPLTFLSVLHPEGPREAGHAFWGAVTLDKGNIEAGSTMGKLRDLSVKAGLIHVNFVQVYGKEPAHAIADYAQHNSYNHIFIGSVGRSALARFLMGSVATELSKIAHCSVTIVRV